MPTKCDFCTKIFNEEDLATLKHEGIDGQLNLCIKGRDNCYERFFLGRKGFKMQFNLSVEELGKRALLKKFGFKYNL